MDKVIVVTGASAGIGAAFARKAGALGAKLVLAARRQDALEAVARDSGEALAVPTDVTQRDQVEGRAVYRDVGAAELAALERFRTPSR